MMPKEMLELFIRIEEMPVENEQQISHLRRIRSIAADGLEVCKICLQRQKTINKYPELALDDDFESVEPFTEEDVIALRKAIDVNKRIVKRLYALKMAKKYAGSGGSVTEL
ncbi:MAG: hypothetical protein WC742_15165 [Gallionellaceae bacterium]|jgi:hypothetical protein